MVRAWDWPTRAFHWALVALIACAWVSHRYAAALGDPTLKWHRWNGYAILILLVFRLIWGFSGSSTSKFAAFLHGPFFTARYALDFLKGRKRPFLGHNPLGTVMIVILLVLVSAQGVLGLFTLEHNEITAGPLKRLISDETTSIVSTLHIRGFNLILLCILVHVSANIAYSTLSKDPTISAMVTGKKPAAAYEDEAEAQIAANVLLRAFIALLAAIVLVFGGILALGGRLF